MKTLISIDSSNGQEVTFSVTIENMPVNNIRKLEGLPRQIAERLIDTIYMNSPSQSIKEREKFIQKILGAE